VTHAGADYQDLFLERFREDGGTWYEFEGGWKKADIRHEVISVRDGDTVEIDVTVTDHGPIIEGDPATGHGIAFRYTATATDNPIAQASLAMLKAGSADELDESMRHWVDPCNNFLFADVHGNIGYLTRGKVPIRSAANAWLPVPGWTGEHEWQGDIPFEEMPRSRNPDTGYIVTANNRIVGEDYPHYLALDYAPEYRARRIRERVKELQGATVADMASVHAERVSIPGRVYAKVLAGVSPRDEASGRAQTKLASWDGSMDPDSVAATIYSAFRLRLHAAILDHLFGPLAEEMLSATGRGAPGHLRTLSSLLVTMAEKDDTSSLPPGVDWRSMAATALAEGVADLADRLGDDMDAWQWGRVHHTAPWHTLSDAFPDLAGLLDPPQVPMGGDGDTPQAGSYSPAGPYTMTGMSVARYVFDLGDWSNSAWITPLGPSGHPGSPHYSDQAPIWGKVDLIPMLYGWDGIESASESEQTLEAG
jgi:penicillin amidase